MLFVESMHNHFCLPREGQEVLHFQVMFYFFSWDVLCFQNLPQLDEIECYFGLKEKSSHLTKVKIPKNHIFKRLNFQNNFMGLRGVRKAM